MNSDLVERVAEIIKVWGMNPFVDGKWPEQELILEWMRRYDVPIVFSKRNALMETLTAIRVERDKELADLRQRAEQAGAERDYYRKAIQDFQDGNYAHPRAFRSKDVGHGVGKCCHGTWYWEECESCNSEHFDNALTNGPAAQSTITELTGQVERLRDFAKDFADEPCAYGDGCPPFAGTRHGTCNNCKARAALKDA